MRNFELERAPFRLVPLYEVRRKNEGSFCSLPRHSERAPKNMDERSGLLPREELHASKLAYDPLVATRRAATGSVVVMAAAALIFGVGFIVQQKTAIMIPDKSNFFKKNAGEILIYKRTHPSANSVCLNPIIFCDIRPRQRAWHVSIPKFNASHNFAVLCCHFPTAHGRLRKTSRARLRNANSSKIFLGPHVLTWARLQNRAQHSRN